VEHREARLDLADRRSARGGRLRARRRFVVDDVPPAVRAVVAGGASPRADLAPEELAELRAVVFP